MITTFLQQQQQQHPEQDRQLRGEEYPENNPHKQTRLIFTNFPHNSIKNSYPNLLFSPAKAGRRGGRGRRMHGGEQWRFGGVWAVFGHCR